ncbi:MAG: YybH family protein [Bacteroidota bacterium]
MGKENVGQGLGLTVISIGVVLSAIGLGSIVSDLSAAVPPTPDAIIQTQPPAAVPITAANGNPTASQAASLSDKTEGELKNLVQNWRKAWASQNIASYLAFYAPDYQGNADSPEQWRNNRKRILGQARFVDIRIGQPYITVEGDNVARMIFPLDYASDRLQDHGTKLLELRREKGQWLIEHEEFTPN